MSDSAATSNPVNIDAMANVVATLTLTTGSPDIGGEHDETERSLSPEDLLYLLLTRFLDVLVIDLQRHTDGTTKDKIIGAYVLRGLSNQLQTSPNLGSAVYSIISNEGLRSLMSNLGSYFCRYQLTIQDVRLWLSWMKTAGRRTLRASLSIW
jgi:hypothetical protein